MKQNPETDTNSKNIYQKLATIQTQIGQLEKTEYNAFLKYKSVAEYNILLKLKPLLKEQQLLLTFADVPGTFTSQKVEKEWVVNYEKRATLTNLDNSSEQLTFTFFACATNTDVAKAKGSAETYAIKYFLLKFFAIPTSDNLDPDNDAVERLYKLYQTKVGEEPTKQATFFPIFDQIMNKLQITGQTDSNNLKMRMQLLKKDDFERVKSYLERIK